MVQKLGILVLIAILYIACGTSSDNNKDIIASINSEQLLRIDVVSKIPYNLKGNDSVAFAKNYVQKWIKSNLILERAKMNLSDEMTEIDNQVEEYRNSLIIYNYEQKLLKEKFDSTVSENEINEYYDKFSDEFKLDFNIIKAIFIKIPRTVNDQYKIKNWIWSGKDEQMKDLEAFCIEYAEEYHFADEWVRLDDILDKIPTVVPNQVQFLAYYKNIDTQDSLYKYYVNIKEYKLIDEKPPVKFVADKIQLIILNKRKLEMLKRIENSIYENALRNNDFTIYE